MQGSNQYMAEVSQLAIWHDFSTCTNGLYWCKEQVSDYVFETPFFLTWFSCRWAAASSKISVEAMILPAALYFWQIPHFMALAYMCRDDYLAGGYPFLFCSLYFVIFDQHVSMFTFPNSIYLFFLCCLGFACFLLMILLVGELHWSPSEIASTFFLWDG